MATAPTLLSPVRDAPTTPPVREAPRTMSRAMTEILQGLRGAERAADHLVLGAEILSTLDLCPEDEADFGSLVRDLTRFAAVLRVRSASVRATLPESGRDVIGDDDPSSAERVAGPDQF